jgi:hypothetical protein
MPIPSHSSRLDHPNNILWEVQIIGLLILEFSPLPCHLVPPRPKYPPQHPNLQHTGLCSSLIVSDHDIHILNCLHIRFNAVIIDMSEVIQH